MAGAGRLVIEGLSVPERASLPAPSPAVMRESLIRLGHAVDVVLALEGAALLRLRVEQLAGQALGDRLLPARARELHEPTHGERAGAAGRHPDRPLVGRAADA